jgi:hypothetical protein
MLASCYRSCRERWPTRLGAFRTCSLVVDPRASGRTWYHDAPQIARRGYWSRLAASRASAFFAKSKLSSNGSRHKKGVNSTPLAASIEEGGNGGRRFQFGHAARSAGREFLQSPVRQPRMARSPVPGNEQANQAALDASAAAAKQSFGYVGGGGGSPVQLRFVSAVESLVLVVGGSLAVANLLSSIHSVLGLLGFIGTGYAIVKLGRRVLRSRFTRPIVALLSVLAWGLGGFVIASLLWPHDLVWQIVFLCGGLALAYFDKRAMFRGV